MENKPLSLSKKLDGGYLHVKKKDSNVKRRVSKGGSNGKGGRRGGYLNYLKRVNGVNKDVTKQYKTQEGGKYSDPNKKVVSIKLGGSKKKRGKAPKNKSDAKDISRSPITPVKNVIPSPPEPAIRSTQKGLQKPPEKKGTPQPTEKKGLPLVMPKTKGSLKKGKVVRRHRVTSKGRGRSLTRRRCHDLRKGKRISVTKIRKLSNKDVDNIQSKLKSIKGKSTDEIKTELDKQGIQVSGKSPSILKDIYMYSQLCGINIKRE